MTPLGLFGLFALIPAMTGPLGTKPSIEIALCSGGTLVLASGGGSDPGGNPPPACAKGCHGETHRKRAGAKR